MAWTSLKTWATNDILTSTDLNTYVRDNMLALGTWTSYSPTWTASTTNPTIGNGTIQGRYLLTTDWCEVWIGIKAGSTTSFGSGNYTISLPVANISAFEGFLNVAHVLDAATARYPAYGLIAGGASNFQIYTLGASPVIWSNTQPFTFGSTDVATAQGKYRIL